MVTLTTEQKRLMAYLDTWCANHRPPIAVRPSLGVDGTASVELVGATEADRDAAVAELAGVFQLGCPELVADRHAYAATHHGVAVWTAHEGVS